MRRAVRGAVMAALCVGGAAAQIDPRYRGLAVDAVEVQATVLVDLDDDGVLDLVAGVDIGDDLGLQRFRGGGEGAFFPVAGPIATGATESVFHDLEAGDLNGDGHPDVVATIVESDGSGELHVALGAPGGGLVPLANLLFVEDAPTQIELTDADGDGHLDALAMNRAALWLFAGRGDGTFEPGLVIGTSLGPAMFHVADLDGDRDDDLVVADPLADAIEVLISDGAGTYTSAQIIATPTPRDVTSADLDGDGDLDLATASGEGLTILRRNAAGLYRDLTVLPFNEAWRIEAGDYDNDGHTDLVGQIGPKFGASRFFVFGGSGDFTFEPIALEKVPYRVVSVEPALLNGDLETDWVVTYGAGFGVLGVQSVQVGLGRPDEASLFAPSTGDSGVQDVVLADLNADGFDDRVMQRGTGGPAVSLANGSGFDPKVSYAGQGEKDALAVGDVDGDGVLDVVLGAVGALILETSLGVGDGSLTGPVVSDFGVPGMDVVDVALGDLDGDGDDDAVALVHDGNDSFLAPLESDGAGGFSAGPPIVESGRGHVIAVGDLDGDGVLDLVDVTKNLLRVRRGVPGSLTFEPPFEVELANATWAEMLVTRLPGDAIGDVLLGGSTGIHTLRGAVGPLGELSLALQPSPLVEGVSDIDLFDATGDGLPDLVATDAKGYETRVYRGRIDDAGGFGFQLSQRIATDATLVAAGRIDGPEDDDFVALSVGRGTLHLRERPWSWVSIGGGGAPAGLDAPSLRGSGDPVPGESINLLFGGGRPNAPAILVIGLAPQGDPPSVSGIELIPTLDLLVPLPPADASGDIRLDTTWTDFPPGVGLWTQVWQVAPFDVRASPGLRVESR